MLAPYELLYNLSFIKAGLRARGVITHIHSRVPAPRLDPECSYGEDCGTVVDPLGA